ncbi:MAG: long-chain fatty acid--CoA ligase, partial [Alphaproteobacteria bacterium]
MSKASAEETTFARPWLARYPEGVRWDQPFRAQPLHRLLVDAAARYPDNRYLDFHGRVFTYREVHDLVRRAAVGFQALGVGKGVRVGLFLPNCPQFVICYYAILKAGGTVVNFSPLYSVPELIAQVEDSGTEIMVTLDVAMLLDKMEAVLTASRLRQLVIGTLAEVLPFPKNVLYPIFQRRQQRHYDRNTAHLGFADLIANDGAVRAVTIDPDTDVAVLQYTGGTTGVPKGAMLSHANLYVNALQAVHYDPRAVPGIDRVLGALPLFHVFAMTVVLNVATYLGAEIVLMPKFELEQAMRLIARRRITLLPGVPTMYTAMVNHERLVRYDLSSIRLSISGGAPLPVELKQRFEELTGAALCEGYGLTEASGVVAVNPYYGEQKAASVGMPVPGTTIVITDHEVPDKILAQGETGEICIIGPQVMLGYWNRPEESLDVLHAGRLRTGDIGYLDADGYLFIVDRKKDLIKVGGF